jgi:hypothetical protein
MGLLEPHGRGRRNVRRDALNLDRGRPGRLRARRPRSGSAPVFVVHSLAHAVAALEAAGERPVVLLSAPGAGVYAGAGWWRAVIEAACAAAPQAAFTALLDCGDDAGMAMAALRAGAQAVVFTGRTDVAERLQAIAARQGAQLLTARPQAALDLGDYFFADGEALRRRCAEAFARRLEQCL